MSKIVLVTNQFSVVVNGLEKKLKTLQHEVTLVESGFLGIAEDNFRNDVFLIYLPDTLSVDSPKFKELNMLCEKIRNNSCGLILIGAAPNHDQALKTAPLLRGVTWINQPVDIDMLSEEIKKEENRAKNALYQRKVLIVDDDPVYGMMVSNWLKDDYTVSTVNDGMQTISFLTNNRIDLILLDYEMPVVDGPQILQLLRSHPETKDIPVMFLTGVHDKDSIQRVLKLKPEGYILKTATRGEILKILADYFIKKT